MAGTLFANVRIIDGSGAEGSRALRATRKLFAFSILYLFALFAVLLLEVVAHALAPSIW